MKRILIALCLLPMGAFAACPDPLPENTVCLEWVAPTENIDGSPLTDLAGYRVYYGLETGNYLDPPIAVADPAATDTSLSTGEVQIPNPGPAGGDVTVFFAMTALDTDGNESAFSNEVTRTVSFPDTLAPAPPQVLDVIINVVVE